LKVTLLIFKVRPQFTGLQNESFTFWQFDQKANISSYPTDKVETYNSEEVGSTRETCWRGQCLWRKWIGLPNTETSEKLSLPSKKMTSFPSHLSWLWHILQPPIFPATYKYISALAFNIFHFFSRGIMVIEWPMLGMRLLVVVMNY